MFSTKVERERPDVCSKSNLPYRPTDVTSNLLEVSIWSLYAIKPCQLVNCAPISYIRIANALGYKVNYKPNIKHWPKNSNYKPH